ncbi:MAG: hypothetical protein ACLQBK_03015 [Candidatus Sulfotelmatobacter sp.]
MSGIVAVATAIIWFAEKMPGGLWVPVLLILAACACAFLFYLGKRLDKQKATLPAVVQSRSVPAVSGPCLTDNTLVKESDPQLEIKFADLRGKTMSKDQVCFDLINRGKRSSANFACIEDFYIGGYRVAFRNFPPPIRPFGNHDSITPVYINNPDGTLSEKDIFGVFYDAWGALKNPKLYDLPIPIKATYQDDARNLFEARCDLVYYPGEHINSAHGKSAKIIEVKNIKLRKVAAASAPVNWSD